MSRHAKSHNHADATADSSEAPHRQSSLIAGTSSMVPGSRNGITGGEAPILPPSTKLRERRLFASTRLSSSLDYPADMSAHYGRPSQLSLWSLEELRLSRRRMILLVTSFAMGPLSTCKDCCSTVGINLRVESCLILSLFSRTLGSGMPKKFSYNLYIMSDVLRDIKLKCLNWQTKSNLAVWLSLFFFFARYGYSNQLPR